MRGYTTLLSHILGSHSEISGYTETGRSYRTTRDLLRLRFAACRHGNYKGNCTYVLDKILHNKFHISEAILRRNDVLLIFMVREPLSTLRSVVTMPQRNRQAHTEKEALRHHAARLKVLTQTGRRLRRTGKSSLVICAEDLIHQTGTILRRLEEFLQLKTPLDEHYSMFSLTGARGYGDFRSCIREGKIKRRRAIMLRSRFSTLYSKRRLRAISDVSPSFPWRIIRKPSGRSRANPKHARPNESRTGIKRSLGEKGTKRR